MILSRLGIVGFFGLLIPGSYLLGSVLLALFVLGLGIPSFHLPGLATFVQKQSILFSATFLLLSYLLGVLMRLLGPNRLDKISTWYFRNLRRNPVSKKNLWKYEKFPYRWSISTALRRAGLAHIHIFLKKHNPLYARSDNTPFFNYCKLVLEGNTSDMTRITTQAESMVRFLSGTTFALLVSFALWSILGIALAVMGSKYALVSFVAGILSLLLAWPIVGRFKFQRRREVFLVWYSTYLVLTGGVPNSGKLDPENLQKAIFGEPHYENSV